MSIASRLSPIPLGAMLGIGALAVLAPSPAHATSIAPLTLEQMVDGSDLIVRGTVNDVWTTLDPVGVITHATITVERTLKGNASGEVEVIVPGGELDGSINLVDGAPRYGVGERVLVLLSARKDGSYLNVAFGSGKYDVKQNPTDGSDMVVQFTVPYDRAWDFRFLPNPAPADRVSLAALEQRMTDRVTLGWDGKPLPGVSLEHLREINHLQNGVR